MDALFLGFKISGTIYSHYKAGSQHMEEPA